MPELLSTPSRELVKPEMLSLATEQTLRDESPFFCRSIVRLAAHVNLVIFCVVFFFPQTLQPPPEISHSSVTRQPPHWSRVLTGNCCNTCGFSLSCSCRSARFCWRCSGHLSVIYPCLSLHPFLFANWVQILVQMSTFIHTTHVLWWRLRQLWTHAIGPYWFKPMSTDGKALSRPPWWILKLFQYSQSELWLLLRIPWQKPTLFHGQEVRKPVAQIVA